MDIFNKFLRCCFVGITIHMLVCSSFADVSITTSSVVVLEQQMFADLLPENIIIESVDGNVINSNQLPSEAATQLKRLKTSIIPNLELEDAVPQDVVRIIVSKPKPRHMIRLGLISPPSEQIADPVWFDDIVFSNKKLLCIATNISLLNLSFVFADAFNCDFGITTNGEAMFRTKTIEARKKHQFYHIKSTKEPSIMEEKILQKEKHQNSIIIFMVCSIVIMAVLAVLFFQQRKNH